MDKKLHSSIASLEKALLKLKSKEQDVEMMLEKYIVNDRQEWFVMYQPGDGFVIVLYHDERDIHDERNIPLDDIVSLIDEGKTEIDLFDFLGI